MKLSKKQITEIVRGSTILGTGGGGRYDSALSTIKKLKSIELISVDDLPADAIVITAYGAGGLTKPKSSEEAIIDGLALLEKKLGKAISAIVPVEIGPYSIAEAFEIAERLGVPVVDGDLVGYRSVPEIWIELVTLANLPRCPLVYGNNEGDILLMEKSESPEMLENTIRSFADQSTSNTFVLGYPYNKDQLKRCLATGSVSYCLGLSKKTSTEFTFVCSGNITKDKKKESGGFTVGSLEINSDKDVYEVIFKNEFMVLLKDNEVMVTCPDFICIVDTETGRGLNNGDNNKGKNVRVYIRPAIDAWRTDEGLKLFSPDQLSLPYPQKVMQL